MAEGRSKLPWTLIIMFVVAIIVVGAYLLGMQNGKHNSNDNSQVKRPEPSTTTKAAELRVSFNNLMVNDISLTAEAGRAKFDDRPSLNAATAALDKNSNDLADNIGNLYGDEARARFYEGLKTRNDFFLDYVAAVKAKDQTATNAAIQKLNGHIDVIADLFNRANQNLPKDQMTQMIKEHLGLLKNVIDKYAASDYDASYKSEQQAQGQAARIADTLASAIVKQKAASYTE